jgi:hypothetical protein
MQNGGHVSPFFNFFFACVPDATKKTKKRLAATGHRTRKCFCGTILRVTHPHASKKNKTEQNLATQGTIGVRVLTFPALSRSVAQKNRLAAHFLRRFAAVPEILQACSACWRIARLVFARANRGRRFSRNGSRSESGCATIVCCVSSSRVSKDFCERSAAKCKFVHSSTMSWGVS